MGVSQQILTEYWRVDLHGQPLKSIPANFSERAQIFLHFIVAADQRYPETFGQAPKNRPKRKPSAAFKEVGAQFADAQAAMCVRVTKCVAAAKNLSKVSIFVVTDIRVQSGSARSFSASALSVGRSF
jgi:hypothetical protein